MALIAGAYPTLTKTPSGSATIDAVVATKTTPAPTPGAYADVATYNYVEPPAKTIDGRGDVTWVLLMGQHKQGGKNGIYKRDANGGLTYQGAPDLVGVTGGTYNGNIFKLIDNPSIAWGMEYVNNDPTKRPIVTIVPEKTTQISMPSPALSTSVPVLTMLSEPTIKNTGVTGGLDPKYGTVLPETEIVATPLTAFGLEFKPMHLAIAAVVLIVGYFVWKKYGK